MSSPAPRDFRYTSHDGLSLFCRDYGDADNPDVVICLPGLTRNSKDFERLAQHLSGRWRVLTPDLRGRGQSDRDPNWKQYLPPTYVRDTWSLMNGAGIESAAIIGTSLGGLMAMIMADQQPQRMRAVVMNDIGPDIAPAALDRILEYAGRTPPQPDWATAQALTQQAYEIAYPDENDEFWARKVRLGWRETRQGMVAPDYDPAIGDALRHAARSLGWLGWLQKIGIRRLRGINLSHWDNFRQMTMPVLLLRGGVSDLIAPETVRKMQAIKPDLEVVEVPGRGHAPTLDEPESRAAIDAFLSRL